MMRTGPHPLLLHLRLASYACANLENNVQHNLTLFFEGIKKYQSYDLKAQPARLDTVWQSGEMRLLKKKGNGHGAPLLIIPSMINSADIFHLHPEHSFVDFMTDHGRDVYLIDWGQAHIDQGMGTLSKLLKQKIMPALEYIHQDGGQPPFVLGYCLGGVFLAAAAALNPEAIRACIYLATPWDFHAGKEEGMHKLVMAMAPTGRVYLKQHGYLPHYWVQTLFANLDPEKSVRKFSEFARMQAQKDEEIFVCVENWLNEGSHLPAAIGETVIKDFYTDNLPVQGTWKMDEYDVSGAEHKGPNLVVIAGKDRLVPPSSSKALYKNLMHADLTEVQTGHIGLMANRQAPQQIWQKISDWMQMHD